jgi:hydroxymethylglutaryl-CoA lyase
VTHFDASVAGLGGCPYAPGATGNIATEDAVHMLEEMGIATYIRLDALLEIAQEVRDAVGHADSSVLKAGTSRMLLGARREGQTKIEAT